MSPRYRPSRLLLAGSALLIGGLLGATPVEAAVTRYTLDSHTGRSVMAEPDGTVRTLLEYSTNRPALSTTTVVPDRSLFTTTMIPRDRLTRGVAGALLPNDGGIFAYATLRKPRPRVRAFVRTAGRNGRAVTISDRAHSARVSEITASASGAAAVLFFQRPARNRREQMRYALRGVGADAGFGEPVAIPSGTFSRVAYNDAGDGVLVEQVNGDGLAPAVAVRRISRTGEVGPRIVVDDERPSGADVNAAVAPDGSIALLWAAFDSGLPLRWTTLAPGDSTARPAQIVLAEAGDTSNARVVWARDRWVATYAGPLGKTPTITVAEAAIDGQLGVAHSYSPGAGYDGSSLNVALIAGAGGGVDLVWVAGRGERKQILRSHRTATGAWGEPELLTTDHTGALTIWASASRPSGGIALVEQSTTNAAFDRADVTTSLILTTD